MTPLDQLLAADWTPLLAVAVLAAAVVFTGRQIRTYHRSTAPMPRPDRRIPADERALLGDDWRDRVIGPRTEDFIRRTRSRFAIYSVTGADPESSEGQPLSRPTLASIQGDTLESKHR